MAPLVAERGRWGVATERRDDNLTRTRSRLCRLIWANETEWGERPKFFTFTFKDNLTQVAEANAVWSKFARRLKQRFGPMKYLAVTEFQERGAVHYHVIFFNMPYVKGLKKVIAELWGEGFIKLKAIGQIDNVGLYVSKYLTKENADDRLLRKKSFFCSRGLKKPDEYYYAPAIYQAFHLREDNSVLKSTETYQTSYYGTVKKNTYLCF